MKKLTLTVAVALALSSCNHDPKHPGKIYMPDMTYSNAYETYSESTIKGDAENMSARQPVAGTIPHGWIPADDRIRTDVAFLMSYMAKNHFTGAPDKWQAEYDQAGAMLKNPVAADEAGMAEGKRLYEINCKVCHGEKGAGNGQIVELPDGSDGPFTARPPAYDARLKEINPGKAFYAISYGKGMMGGYAHHLNVTQRWQVINYIYSLAGITASAPATADTSAKN